MPLSRKDFVSLCTNAILNARKKIAVFNQESGYLSYFYEEQENNYFSKTLRDLLRAKSEDDYMYRHDLVSYVGLGNCSELADFLLVEIAKEIERHKDVAIIDIIQSKAKDHVYLNIKIKLAGEKKFSNWEVDAWDPRIIDVSVCPDGSIKNREALRYGLDVLRRSSVFTDEINYNQRYSFFTTLRKPQERKVELGDVKWEDIVAIDPRLHNDYTIEAAKGEGKILASEDGELHALQSVSNWQI